MVEVPDALIYLFIQQHPALLGVGGIMLLATPLSARIKLVILVCLSFIVASIVACAPIGPLPDDHRSRAEVGSTLPTDMPDISSIRWIVAYQDQLAPKDKPKAISAYVALRAKPVSQSQISRYLTFCQHWQAEYVASEEAIPAQPELYPAPFYWPVTKRIVSDRYNCSQYVALYDQARAQSLALQYKLDISKDWLILSAPDGVVYLDVTDFETDKEVSLAMRSWKKAIFSMPQQSTQVRAVDIYESARQVLLVLSEYLFMKA